MFRGQVLLLRVTGGRRLTLHEIPDEVVFVAHVSRSMVLWGAWGEAGRTCIIVSQEHDRKAV